MILAVVLAAVCAGARSFTAVAEWAGDVLGKLGSVGRPPSESTIRRTPSRLDAAVSDQAIGVWTWLRTRVIAVDGILRLAGWNNIATALRRHHGRDSRLFRLDGGLA